MGSYPIGTHVDLLDSFFGWRGVYAIHQPCRPIGDNPPCSLCASPLYCRICNLETGSEQHVRLSSLRPSRGVRFRISSVR